MVELHLLKQINIFQDIREDLLERVSNRCKLTKYNLSHILFDYGTRVTSLYMVLNGSVELFLPVRENKLIKIYEAQKGETIGLSSVLPSDCLAVFTAKTSESLTELIEIKSSDLKRLFDEDKEVAAAMTKSLLKAYTLKKIRQSKVFISTISHHPKIKKYIK